MHPAPTPPASAPRAATPRSALPLTEPLREHVAALHRDAADADWHGDTDRARFLNRLAEAAIARGEDPVILF